MVRAMKRKVSMIVLAAGSGSRMGLPKALLRLRAGTPLLEHHVLTMVQAQGPEDPFEIIVVLGASASLARPLVPSIARVVENSEFSTGMGSSLQTGLRAVSDDAEAAIVTLVDLPDTPVDAYRRLRERASPEVLARCTWNRVHGHPVMFGRDLFQRAITACHGDIGAKDLFRELSAQILDIECGDLLASGITGNNDVDTPSQAEAHGLVLPPVAPGGVLPTTGMSDHA